MDDTFTLVNFLYNSGAQYGAVVIAAMSDGNITNLPGIILEPLAGLGVSYKYVKDATGVERQARVATLAALEDHRERNKQIRQREFQIRVGTALQRYLN